MTRMMLYPSEDEAGDQGRGNHSDMPERNRQLGSGCISGLPGTVNDGPRCDCVTDVIGAVRE